MDPFADVDEWIAETLEGDPELAEAIDAREAAFLASLTPDVIPKAASLKPRCRHCRSRSTRRRSGLCDACHMYERKYGRLPDEDVLIRRSRRA